MSGWTIRKRLTVGFTIVVAMMIVVGGLAVDRMVGITGDANVVAKSIGAGLGDEGLNFMFDAASASRLGLDFPALARVCLQTEEGLRELRKIAA